MAAAKIEKLPAAIAVSTMFLAGPVVLFLAASMLGVPFD